jgi:hypothetical protein
MIPTSKWNGDEGRMMSVVKFLVETLGKLNVKDDGEDTGSGYYNHKGFF